MNALFSIDGLDGSRESIERYSLELALKKTFENVFYIDGSYPKKDQRSLYFSLIRELNRKSNIVRNHYSYLLRNNERKILKQVPFNKFDIFISVNQYHSKEFISLLKKENPNIISVLFLWDKFDTTEIRETTLAYDYTFSFDPVDCDKYGFIFRPSFFTSQNVLNEETNKTIDLYYLGRFKEERYKSIIYLYDYCMKLGLKTDLRLYIDKKNSKRTPPHEILTKKNISYNENLILAKKAKVILELNLKNQTGLTLRSLECLSSKSKLITNNKHIENYDFYNENNIFIINSLEDIDNIPYDFFTSPYQNIDSSVISKYSAIGFIDEILCTVGLK